MLTFSKNRIARLLTVCVSGFMQHHLTAHPTCQVFFFECARDHRYLHSFPTRRSSDLLSWRQDAALSGYNMLTLGILHETLLRWVPPPVHVLAQVHAFISKRIDPESGVSRAVGTPDRSEEHTSELQSRQYLVCRLLLEK